MTPTVTSAAVSDFGRDGFGTSRPPPTDFRAVTCRSSLAPTWAATFVEAVVGQGGIAPMYAPTNAGAMPAVAMLAAPITQRHWDSTRGHIPPAVPVSVVARGTRGPSRKLGSS